MSGGILYFCIALATWPVFAYVLHRIERPKPLWRQLLAAAGMASLWPLAVSLGSFGGVAVARLIRTSAKKAEGEPNVAAAVSPPTVNV